MERSFSPCEKYFSSTTRKSTEVKTKHVREAAFFKMLIIGMLPHVSHKTEILSIEQLQ